MPPAVEPVQPPVAMETISIGCTDAGSAATSVVLKPVLVCAETPSRSVVALAWARQRANSAEGYSPVLVGR